MSTTQRGLQITQPEGWTDAKTDQLGTILDAKPDYNTAEDTSS